MSGEIESSNSAGALLPTTLDVSEYSYTLISCSLRKEVVL